MDSDCISNFEARLGRIENLLTRIESNTDPGEDVSHIKRKEVDPEVKKVYVKIRTNVMNVGDIDGVNQEFKAKYYIGAKWKEPALKGKTQEEIKWDETWQPRIMFHNCVNEEERRLKCYLEYDEEEDDGIPWVRYSYQIKGAFKEKLELKDFPFDAQELNMILLSEWPYRELEFEKNMEIKDSIRTDSFDGGQTWNLMEMVKACPVRQGTLKTGSHKEYHKYVISMIVVRKAGFYVWNVLLIIGLIMILTFASLAVEPTEPADRLSVTLTLLLTSVAFKFVVSQNLPIISYVTLLDSYVLFCLIFQCVMVVQNSTASLFSTVEAGRQYDWICAIILLAAVVIFHVVWGLIVGLKIRKRNQWIKKRKQEYDVLCEDINQEWQQKQQEKKAREKYQKQADEARKGSRKRGHKHKRKVHNDERGHQGHNTDLVNGINENSQGNINMDSGY